MAEEQLRLGQAVGIGLVAGIISFAGLFLLVVGGIQIQSPQSWAGGGFIYISIASLVLGWPTILLGLVGAFVGMSWKHNKRATWIGAFIGAAAGSSLWMALSVMSIFFSV